jgi:deoxyribodipyrimidine photo-lyase
MIASTNPPVICWFRQDLRLGDNPALSAAVHSGHPLLPVYILDDVNAGDWAMGAASRWWLHQSLTALDAALHGALCCFNGRADQLLPELVRRVGAVGLYANQCVEPWRVACDARIEAALSVDGVEVHFLQSATLFDPASVAKSDGTPYRVFTPFYRRGCLQGQPPPREPLPAPRTFKTYACQGATTIDELDLLPGVPWYRSMQPEWQVGEAGALRRLDAFLDSGLVGYQENRNRPDRRSTSRLSPHLHFGELSPNQAWYAVQPLLSEPRLERDVDNFRSELGWREFSHYLLWHWPSLPTDNWQAKFDRFPWQSNTDLLERWQHGLTGYPIVDAGMRELWQTGYMHNRVRMIVGSFLVKNLLLHWSHGEEWFWDTLVDADLANNSASWQWIAGCGADAAPYFRIFNPVIQGQKFDPEGDYVRRFLPELEVLPKKYMHRPWDAPGTMHEALDYPSPVVELQASREQALAAFSSLSI